MAAYAFPFNALPSMNDGFCRLVKINVLILKGTAFIFSKCCFD